MKRHLALHFSITSHVSLPVYAHAGTLEEVIYKRQMNKMALAARVVDAHMPVNQFASEVNENRDEREGVGCVRAF